MFNNRREKDERFVAVEKSSTSLAFWILTFAIMADIFYRNMVLKQNTWDLWGILGIANFVAVLYQARYKILSRTNAIITIVVFLLFFIWIVLSAIFKFG